MILDARSLPNGTVAESEVCIIGAGAAGITLARELGDAPFRVVLLESGGFEYEDATEELYDGRSIGRPFEDLRTCRLRYFGGTTNHWGGWCLPYDAIDFEPRPGLPDRGWPFPRSHLDPWYRRAQQVCQIGPFDYAPADWGIPSQTVPPPFSGPHFVCKILQQSPTRFGQAYRSELQRAQRLTVYLHANALTLRTGDNHSEVTEVAVATLSGVRFTVRARIFILAAGGIENPRLLLLSGAPDGPGLGNARDLVGRFLMVHLVYQGGLVALADPHRDFSFYTGRAGRLDRHFGGTYSFVSFFGLSEQTMRRRQLPGIKIMWLYQFAPVLSAVEALKRLHDGEGPGGSTLTDLVKVLGDLEGVGDFLLRKAVFGQGVPVAALALSCSSEQLPNRDSRVLLDSTRDALGQRRVMVDWHWTAEDKRKAAATLRLLGADLGRTGFGRLRSALSDDDETWPEDFYGDEHHMGTTRMHADPARGVVDADCRVHGVANLYVAGSSVFPTGGANNPTLTIVALALRLADHIRERLA